MRSHGGGAEGRSVAPMLVFVALFVLGGVVAIWHRVRVWQGADPLGATPDGEFPDTSVALVLAGLAWYAARAVAAGALGDDARATPAMSVAVSSGINLAVALALLSRARSGTRRPALPLARLVAAGVLGGLVVLAAAGALATWIEVICEGLGERLPPQDVIDLARKSRGADFTTIAVGAVLVAPFAEEVFFRGILLPVAVRIAGVSGGLLLQALCFGAIHVSSWGTLPLAIPLAVVGWICGWLYVRTGSLLVPILAHATFNAINVGGLWWGA